MGTELDRVEEGHTAREKFAVRMRVSSESEVHGMGHDGICCFWMC
jgi:hypothetical protein